VLYKINFLTSVNKVQKSFTKTKTQFIKLNDFFGILQHI